MVPTLDAPSLGPARYLLGVLALVVGILGLHYLGGRFVNAAVAGTLPAWLPRGGTVGETVTLYLLAKNAYAYLVVPAAAFWLGRRYERSRD